MRPLYDDELRWDDLVAQTVLSPEFEAAWDALNGSGIGSGEAGAHVGHLIRDSEWHLKRLEVQHAEIMVAAARAAQGDEVAHAKLDHQVAGALLTAAASYLIMGSCWAWPSSPAASASPTKKCSKKRSRWSIKAVSLISVEHPRQRIHTGETEVSPLDIARRPRQGVILDN